MIGCIGLVRWSRVQEDFAVCRRVAASLEALMVTVMVYTEYLSPSSP